MMTIAIGGLDDDVVRFRDGFRIRHDRIVIAAQVAGEHQTLAADVDLRRRRSKNVAGPA
ncbi:MAG: hypothetical protein BWZ07_03018 [Alphaproteobacteria bacterium ADurb.BinA280]|nr:MAG: hypothetical protein BWZ07_03018 [Alphaproteobacteria bacterium ADurb.BinA280]